MSSYKKKYMAWAFIELIKLHMINEIEKKNIQNVAIFHWSEKVQMLILFKKKTQFSFWSEPNWKSHFVYFWNVNETAPPVGVLFLRFNHICRVVFVVYR